MPNTISLSTTVNTDGTATIVDGTTFTDPVRVDTGVFVKVFKVDYLSEQTELDVTTDTEDPETVSEFTFNIEDEGDGWYQAYYASIPNYNPATPYVQYDAVKDASGSNVYVAVQASTGQVLSNPTYWTLEPDPATLVENIDTAEESLNIDAVLYNTLIKSGVNTVLGDAALAAAAEEPGIEPNEVSEADLHFAFVDHQIEAANIAALRQQFAAAERYIRRLDDFLEA
jgi:hypothetical protein